MKNVRAPLVREYLEVLVTQDTQFEYLLVPAGTRLLGLPAPADASGKPDSVSLMVPNGSIWAFDTGACRVKPRKLKSSAEPQSDQTPQTVLSELIERQLDLVWLALDEVEDDARLSRRARLNKLYQALAQVAAVGGGEPDAETAGDITEAETEIFGLLSDALLESTIPAKQARKFMQPLALWAAASMQAMLTLSTEQCSGCALLSGAEPGACMVNVARAARINTLYASGLLCQQPLDVAAMKEQSQRLVRLEAYCRLSGPGQEQMEGARMNLLTTLALLQLQSGQTEAFESTLETALTAVMESLPAWLDGAGFPPTEDVRGDGWALLRRPDQRWSLN